MKNIEEDRTRLLAEVERLAKKVTELESSLKDREEIEQELQESKEILEMIVNNIPNQVFWKDRDLVYMGCNRAFAEVTGMGTPSNVIGKTDHDFHRDATHADSYRAWDKKIMDAGEAVLEIEEPYHSYGGQEGTVLTSKVPLRDKNGRVFGLLGICTDITQRKKMEIENRKLIEELREAISKVKTLRGLLPICASCKKIRDDKGYWNLLEAYLQEHSDVDFTHSICPECAAKLYESMYKA